MKATLRTIAMTVALAISLAVMPGLARADEAKIPNTPQALIKALAEAGKPSAEHQKLEPFVGDWTCTVRMWTDPSQPPLEMKGTAQRKWIMDGRFVQETFKGECDGKRFEGMGVLGYDNARKKFTTVRICGLCGTISSALSTCDSSGRKFECATEECCPLTGEKVKGRDEVVIESDERIVMTGFRTVDGKEVKAMEIVSIRKK